MLSPLPIASGDFIAEGGATSPAARRAGQWQPTCGSPAGAMPFHCARTFDIAQSCNLGYRYAGPFRGLRASSQRRNDRRELDVGRCGAECIELNRVQEHHAALAAGKDLSLVPAAVLPHDADAVIALKCADPAAPYAARYGNGRGHGEIVVILLWRCPFSPPGEEILYGGDEHQLDERSW